jgi:hypothetical protein
MANARFAPSQHDDLLSQHQHLGPQRRAWPEQIDDSLKNYPAEIQHAAEDHPILRLMPTGWNLRQGQEEPSTASIADLVFSSSIPYRCERSA